MQSHFFDHLTVILLIVTCVLVLFSKLRMPTVLGYLVVGVVVGPDVLHLFATEQEASLLSELGIILMMFMIGLDFAWPKLRKNIRMISIAGSASVISITGVTMLILMYGFGLSAAAAFMIGGATSMSSSVIINKQLVEQKEFYDSHGRIAFGITIFQDFAALVFLAAIPALAHPDAATIGRNVAVSVGTAFAVLVSLYFIGQKVERPVMRSVAALKSNEIFLMVTLLIIIGAGWVSNFFHLPTTLGAFLAGMVVGETDFKHKIEDDIRPFRDVMVGIFYIVMGMSLKLAVIGPNFLIILGMLAAILVIKLVLTAIVVFAYAPNFGNSIRVGLVLSSCDELSLMIVILGIKEGIINPELGNLLLVAFVLSLVLSTFLILYNRAITFGILSLLGQEKKLISSDQGSTDEYDDLSGHVILCGFGETGKNFFRVLEPTQIPIMAIDVDPIKVETASTWGCNAMYGDATNLNTLKSAGMQRARAMILTFDNYTQTLKILHKIRSECPGLPVIVRVHHISHIEDLMMFGATAVFADGLGTSLSMQQDIMRVLKIPENITPAD